MWIWTTIATQYGLSPTALVRQVRVRALCLSKLGHVESAVDQLDALLLDSPADTELLNERKG